MEMMAMADINDYLDGLDIKFSEQEKQLADIFAESWEYCRSHVCKDCEYMHSGEHRKMLMCMSCQYAKRLIAADVAPVKHGHWIQIDKNKCECSNCGIIVLIAVYPHGDKNYCPNCGAKMDGGEGE